MNGWISDFLAFADHALVLVSLVTSVTPKANNDLCGIPSTDDRDFCGFRADLPTESTRLETAGSQVPPPGIPTNLSPVLLVTQETEETVIDIDMAEERAAILEFEAGLCREDAEAGAGLSLLTCVHSGEHARGVGDDPEGNSAVECAIQPLRCTEHGHGTN